MFLNHLGFRCREGPVQLSRPLFIGLFATTTLRYLIYISMHSKCNIWASLRAQLVKNLPAMQETWVGSLGRSLEKGKATYFSILARRIPWTA